DARALEAAALPVALRVVNAREEARVDGTVRGDLLDDLIDRSAASVDGLARRARQLGWDPRGEYVLAVVDLRGVEPRSTRLRAQRLAAGRGGLATERDGTMVLALPGREDGVDGLGDTLRAPGGERPTVALARAAVGIESMADAHAEARQA